LWCYTSALPYVFMASCLIEQRDGCISFLFAFIKKALLSISYEAHKIKKLKNVSVRTEQLYQTPQFFLVLTRNICIQYNFKTFRYCDVLPVNTSNNLWVADFCISIYWIFCVCAVLCACSGLVTGGPPSKESYHVIDQETEKAAKANKGLYSRR
jgi:hypothetical protein